MAKSIKLTTAHKEDIVNCAVSETFAARNVLAKEKESILADLIYGEIVGPYLGTMQKLPEDFFQSSSRLQIHFVDVGRGDSYIDMRQARRQPQFSQYGRFAKYQATHKYTKRYAKIKAEKDEIGKEERELRQAVYEVLKGINTAKQLRELWPEGEKYLPAQNSTTDNLPAVCVDKVNGMIASFRKG